MWSNMVQSITTHYIEKYVDYEVSRWRFESWNEPDHKDFGPGLNFTLGSFLNYYDATSEGLRRATPALMFGGPGGSCR